MITFIHKQKKLAAQRIALFLQRLTKNQQLRPQYLYIAAFCLILAASAAFFLFKPKHQEQPFNTFVPKQKISIPLEGGKSLDLVAVYGEKILKKPNTVFADEKKLYVSDAAANDVKVLGLTSNKTIAVIKGTGAKQKKALNYPNGIAAFTVDKVLVTETGNKSTIIYKRDSAFVRELDHKKVILKPGYAVERLGNIYVADLLAHDIKVIDNKGTIITTIGSAVNGKNLMKFPQGMDLDQKGNLWVADGGNERVICFDKDGHYLNSFNGAQNGTPFSMVKGLAVLDGNYLAVSDPIANKVRIFDINNNLKEVATLGANKELLYPMGLYADAGNHLFIADRGNGRVQEYILK